MNKVIFSAIVLCLSVQAWSAMAQNKADSVQAIGYLQTGDSLMTDGRYEEANASFDSAAVLFRRLNLSEKYLDCQSKIADNLFTIRSLDEAEDKAGFLIESSIGYLGEGNPYQADGLLILGKVDLVKQQSDLGLTSFKKALKIREVLTDEFDINTVKIYNAIGSAHFMKGEFEVARENWERAVNSIEENVGTENYALVNLYMNIGAIHDMKGDYDLALIQYQKSLAVALGALGERHGTTAILYNNIGNAQLRLGFYESAIGYFEKSIAVNKDIFGENYINLAPTYNNLGKVYNNLERYELALQYMEKALTIFIDQYGESNPDVAATYTSMGQVYVNFEREGDQALDYLFKAVEIYSKLDIEQYDLAATYSNIATKYSDRTDYEQALKYSRKAFDIWLKIDPGHPEISEVYAVIGEVYRQEENFDEAVKNHENSITHFQDNVSEKHPALVRYYLNLGITYQEMGKFSESLVHFQNALIANVEDFSDTSIVAAPVLKNSYDQFYLLRTIHRKAISFEARADKKQDSNSYEVAMDHYLLCDTLLDNLTRTPLKFQSRLKFEELRSEIYTNAINLGVKLYDRTGDPRYIEWSFYFVEKSKVRILSESSFDKLAKQLTSIPEALLKEEERIGERLSYYQTRLKEAPELANEQNYKAEIFSLERAQDSLVNYLESNYPQYFQLKYSNQVLSHEKIAALLDDNTAVIEYFLNDDDGYIFLITRNDFSFYQLNGVSKLIKNIDEFRSELQPKDQNFEFNNVERLADVLYQELIEPVAPTLETRKVDQLIIVADKELNYLPFELLINSSAKSYSEQQTANSIGPHYMIMDYNVSYANSGTLHFQEKVKRGTSNYNLISFAPSYSDLLVSDTASGISLALRNQMVPLDWNTKEVASIAEFFSGDTNQGETATESRFKSHVNDYDIIHLATHAIVDDKDPLNSKIVFYQNEDTVEDGFLHAFELYNMKLSSELAVLSACRTGSGKLVQGEGILSLGRSFAYAGVPSIVMSHWQVDDQSTSVLMKNFYGYLSEGYAKSVALRRAKLDYLESASPNKAHPFFWGAFVVIGDDAPLTGQDFNWLYIVLFALSLILVLFILSKRKSRSTG